MSRAKKIWVGGTLGVLTVLAVALVGCGEVSQTTQTMDEPTNTSQPVYEVTPTPPVEEPAQVTSMEEPVPAMETDVVAQTAQPVTDPPSIDSVVRRDATCDVVRERRPSPYEPNHILIVYHEPVPSLANETSTFLSRGLVAVSEDLDTVGVDIAKGVDVFGGVPSLNAYFVCFNDVEIYESPVSIFEGMSPAPFRLTPKLNNLKHIDWAQPNYLYRNMETPTRTTDLVSADIELLSDRENVADVYCYHLSTKTSVIFSARIESRAEFKSRLVSPEKYCLGSPVNPPAFFHLAIYPPYSSCPGDYLIGKPDSYLIHKLNAGWSFLACPHPSP